jgi:hypothetical protein
MELHNNSSESLQRWKKYPIEIKLQLLLNVFAILLLLGGTDVPFADELTECIILFLLIGYTIFFINLFEFTRYASVVFNIFQIIYLVHVARDIVEFGNGDTRFQYDLDEIVSYTLVLGSWCSICIFCIFVFLYNKETINLFR